MSFIPKAAPGDSVLVLSLQLSALLPIFTSECRSRVLNRIQWPSHIAYGFAVAVCILFPFGCVPLVPEETLFVTFVAL